MGKEREGGENSLEVLIKNLRILFCYEKSKI